MISDVLSHEGYATHHVGKWHIGHRRSWQYPSNRGFHTSLGFMGGSNDYVTQRVGECHPDWICNGVDLQRNAEPAIGINGTFSGQWISDEVERILRTRNH